MNKKHTLIRFLTSYVIIFAIPFIAIFFVYKSLVYIIEKNCKDYNITMLEQCKNLVDARMQEINGIIIHMDNNYTLNDLMYQISFNTGSTSYDMKRIWDDISVFSLSNRFIYDFFIFNEGEDFLISSKSVIPKLSEAYGIQIDYGDMPLQQFKNVILTKDNPGRFIPENTIKYKNGKKYDVDRVIGYTRPLPLNSDKPRGSITFFISTEKILDIFKYIYPGEGGSSFVIDRDGKVLMAYPDNSQLPSETSFTNEANMINDTISNRVRAVSYQIYSKYSGLTFISIMPYSIVLKRVVNIQRVLLIPICVILFVGFWLSYIMAYKHSKPITEVVKLLATSVSYLE